MSKKGIKVSKAKAYPKEELWDENFFDIDEPEHSDDCDHFDSAFGEHCTCGVLAKLV